MDEITGNDTAETNVISIRDGKPEQRTYECTLINNQRRRHPLMLPYATPLEIYAP